MDFIPEKSEIQIDTIRLDPTLKDLIKTLGIKKLIPQANVKDARTKKAQQ